jgi:hypothetical protein
MLYKFQHLKIKLDEEDYPSIDEKSGFKIIKGIDFEKAYRNGSISFEDDGIYLEYEGKKYRGYMFIKEPWITKFNSYPVFHLTKCEKINEFIVKGNFKVRYEWSNSNINDLIDITTKELYQNQTLKYCQLCKRLLFKEIHTTEDFFETLDKSEIENRDVEVDIFGYVKNKEKISTEYRKIKKYTCESCSIKPQTNIDKMYWHTHHINGDKLNNSLSNLKCLCVLCHSFIDDKHKENFSNSIMKHQLKTFISKYKGELIKLGNPYLSQV